MRLINRQNLAVIPFSARENSRYTTLQSILVTPAGETVATDGHCCLGWVSPAPMDKECFPDIPGASDKPDSGEPVLLPVKVAELLDRSIPKKSPMPILAHALISGDKEDGTAVAAVTDLDNPQVFPFRPEPGQFPNYELVIPKMPDAEDADPSPAISVALDIKLLSRALKAMDNFKGLKGNTLFIVRLTVYRADKAIRLDATNQDTGQGMTVVIMPCRPDRCGDFPNTYGNPAAKVEDSGDKG